MHWIELEALYGPRILSREVSLSERGRLAGCADVSLRLARVRPRKFCSHCKKFVRGGAPPLAYECSSRSPGTQPFANFRVDERQLWTPKLSFLNADSLEISVQTPTLYPHSSLVRPSCPAMACLTRF